MPGLLKRSIMLAGHRTSIALEEEFWRVLEDAARARTQTLPVLIAEIDGARPKERLLASACRVFALAWAQGLIPPR